MIPTRRAAPLLVALLALLAVGAPAAAATPAAPGGPTAARAATRLLEPAAAWRGVRWGATLDEVLRAFPGEVARLRPEERLADGAVVAAGIEAHPVGPLTYRVRFLFREGRLALVSLKSLPGRPAGGDDYEALKGRLAAETGRSGQERAPEAQVDYREVRFSAGLTAVDVKYLPGTLVLLYHPSGG